MKKYFLVLVVIATLLTGCSVFKENDSLSPKSKRALRNGNIYFAQQNLVKARGFLVEVLEDYPNHLEANKKMADIHYFEAENNDKIAYESYLKAHDEYQIVYNQLKDVGREDMSRDERRWYKDSRKKITSIHARILILANKEYELYKTEQIGDRDEIISKYYNLIDLEKDNLDPYKFLTVILNNQKRDLRMAEGEDNEFEISKLDNEILYLLSQWVRIDPNNLEDRTTYAKQLYALKRYDEAIEQANELIKQDPYNYDHYDLYASIAELQEEHQAAFDKMEAANSLIPENVKIYKSLLYFAKKLKNDEAYLNYSKDLIEIEASPENLSTFASFLYTNQMWEELLVYSEKWFMVDKKNKTPAQFAAYAAQKTKDTNKYNFYAKKYKELDAK